MRKINKSKRYFWLKLKDDFFNQKEIKMLRKIAGGDTYTIIYLKMLLLSLKNDGKIYYDGIAGNFVEEIALDIDEDIENTQVTFNYLQQKGLIEFETDNEIDMVNIASMIGSETEVARRVRKHRNNKALQSNNQVTHKEHLGNTEIEKELDIEIDKEKDKHTLDATHQASVIDEQFDEWWNTYDKKLDKKTAKQKFKIALKKHTFEVIMKGTREYIKTIEDKDYQKYPVTFLNKESYLNDYAKIKRKATTSNEVASMEEELGIKREPTRELTEEELKELDREELSF